MPASAHGGKHSCKLYGLAAAAGKGLGSHSPEHFIEESCRLRSMLNEVTNFSLRADSGEQGFIHQWPAADMLTSSTKTIVGKASRSDILSCGLANAVWALRTIMLAAWAVSSKGVVHEQPPQVVFSIMLAAWSTNAADTMIWLDINGHY